MIIKNTHHENTYHVMMIHNPTMRLLPTHAPTPQHTDYNTVSLLQ